MRKFIFILIFLFIFCNSIGSQILYNLEGKEFNFSGISSYSKVVLFFWTSQCPFCIAELVKLNKNFDFSKYKDIRFFYVNIGESKTIISKYARSLKLIDDIKNNIFLDTFGFLSRKYYIQAIPTYIFLKDGKIIKRSFFLDEKLIEEIF